MEERVLLDLISFIRINGRLPGLHEFQKTMQQGIGSDGRAALNALVAAHKIQTNSVGYFPTISALRSLAPDVLAPEVATARRLLPLIVAHYEDHQGNPLELAGIDLAAEPGAMALPFVALMCSAIPVSASGTDTAGGALSITTNSGVWDLDARTWPFESPAPPAVPRQVNAADAALWLMVDEWAKGVDLDRWRCWTQLLLGVRPTIFVSDFERLYFLYDWLRSRVFQDERHPVVEALRNFSDVLRDFLVIVENAAEHLEKRDAYAITTTWKRERVSEAEFQRHAASWQRKKDEFDNLALELVRAVNLVLKATRVTIDAAYRLDLGRLPVASWPTENNARPWIYVEYADRQKYPGKTEFFKAEYLTRDYYVVLAGHEKRAKAQRAGATVNKKEKKVRTTPTNGRTPGHDLTEGEVLTWLHVSDLHFGHGDAEHRFDQAVVLRELANDVALAGTRGVPSPDLLLVTGDVAFSGGADRNTGEENSQYTDARTWIEGLCNTMRVSMSSVYMVPGNHDVIRPRVKSDRNLGRLIKELREGAPLGNALSHVKDHALLESYQELFWKHFRRDGQRKLFWEARPTTKDGTSLRIVGLNTSLLALDGADKDKLQLGMAQVDFLSENAKKDDITIVLTHHPVGEEWLHDRDRVGSHLAKYATIHLHGHTHRPRTAVVSHGSGGTLATVVAGAAHADSGEPQSHGYNFAALVRTRAGLVLRVWPRRWSPENAEFKIDPSGVPDGETHADHVLLRYEVPLPVGKGGKGVKKPASHTHLDGRSTGLNAAQSTPPTSNPVPKVTCLHVHVNASGEITTPLVEFVASAAEVRLAVKRGQPADFAFAFNDARLDALLAIERTWSAEESPGPERRIAIVHLAHEIDRVRDLYAWGSGAAGLLLGSCTPTVQPGLVWDPEYGQVLLGIATLITKRAFGSPDYPALPYFDVFHQKTQVGVKVSVSAEERREVVRLVTGSEGGGMALLALGWHGGHRLSSLPKTVLIERALPEILLELYRRSKTHVLEGEILDLSRWAFGPA